MANKSKARSARQQRRLKKQVQKVVKKVDSMVFFNLLTSPQLLEPLEELLPEFRERLYPPTVTLAMFLGQVLSADSSCQNALNQAAVNRQRGALEPYALQPGTGLFDASVTWVSPGSSYEVSLWGRNLADKAWIAHVYTTANEVFGVYGDPRTYGVRVNWHLSPR